MQVLDGPMPSVSTIAAVKSNASESASPRKRQRKTTTKSKSPVGPTSSTAADDLALILDQLMTQLQKLPMVSMHEPPINWDYAVCSPPGVNFLPPLDGKFLIEFSWNIR